MRKSIITLTVAASVGLAAIFGGSPIRTSAESISGLKGEQSKIQEKRAGIHSDINKAGDKISDLQNQQIDVKAEMKRIDYAISDTTTKINEKTAKIATTQAEIAKLQAETNVLKERIKKRNLLLKDRARSYQETGGVVNYIDVMMGSTSFNDFIDRANAVATIVQADQDLIKQHEADKRELEQKQNQVETDLASLQKMKKDLEDMNQQLTVQKAEKDKLLASLKSQEKEVEDGMMDLKEQEQILKAQETAIQKSIKLEQERQAKAAAEAKRRAQASASRTSRVSSGGGGGGAAVSAPQVSSGGFTRPAAGAITSGYGGRWGAFHYGVDIAQGGTVPIVSAADGVVYVSHYSSSYGNVVYILHTINGQTYTTVYAHMSERMVSEGQTVSKGQQIGIMGSTGDSTGQHLHFELYKGRWAFHSAINPVGIVPL